MPVTGNLTYGAISSATTYDYTDGPNGPANWGSFASVCQTGLAQSPINIEIDETTPGSLVPIQMSYASNLPIETVNNGKTVQFNLPSSGSMQIGSVTYNLLQLHVHSASEHTFNGGSFELEMHFVHQNASGTLAVLGVMVKEVSFISLPIYLR